MLQNNTSLFLIPSLWPSHTSLAAPFYIALPHELTMRDPPCLCFTVARAGRRADSTDHNWLLKLQPGNDGWYHFCDSLPAKTSYMAASSFKEAHNASLPHFYKEDWTLLGNNANDHPAKQNRSCLCSQWKSLSAIVTILISGFPNS